ncbi:MAG: glutamate--tRNA ligase, partial [Eggerthellaceae bacterium]|nr:glutamate--tRNA ligase [Eggerthellaceae bacterium]
SVNNILKTENSRADEALKGCRKVLADPDIPWEVEALQDECKKLTETLDIKARNLFQPLRVAVCGNMVSPPLFESIELMKREDVISRIDSTMDLIFGPGA